MEQASDLQWNQGYPEKEQKPYVIYNFIYQNTPAQTTYIVIFNLRWLCTVG